MVKDKRYPPALCWNFVGFGFMCFSIGCGISVARATSYQLELMQYKMAVGKALSNVGQVSDTLEFNAETSTIAPQEKRKIKQLTQKSDRILDRVEQDIEKETNKITQSEKQE